ncbi:hypothetical protein Tco_0928795 [Tanacetum coccineum]
MLVTPTTVESGLARIQTVMDQINENIRGLFGSVHEDHMVELKNLSQVTTLQVYLDLFEALLNKVEQPKAYAISLSIGVLKEEIRLAVRMFKPTKLSDVYYLAKMQEATLAVSKSTYSSILPTPKTTLVTPNVVKNEGYNTKGTTLALPSASHYVRPNRPRKQLTQQDMEEKRAKHLCFYCDQRYSHGHKCSGQMYYLEVIACDEVIKDEDCMLTEQGVVNVTKSKEESMP